MMFRSVTLLSAAAAMAAFPACARAADGDEDSEPALTVTGGATIASQYRFRGISLSDEKAALQGTINLTHESGFYAGIWGSSLDGFGELGGSNLELDLYAGYRRQVAEGVTIDGGLLYYAYPGSSGGDFEFFEPYANVSAAIGPVTAKVGAAFAPSQDALGHNSNVYIFGDLSAAIPGTPVTLTGHLGNSHGDTPLTPSGDYLDWSLGASVAWKNLTAGVAYVDTNLSGGEAAMGGATRDIVDGAIVMTLTASF
jgi:uncharacterized protein (TIGR02001 family)